MTAGENARAGLAAHAERLLAQAVEEDERGDPADVRRLLHRAELAEIASKRNDPIAEWLELLAEEADTMARAWAKAHAARASAVQHAAEQMGAASMAGQFSRWPRLRDLCDKAVKEEKADRRKLAEAERAAHAARHRFIEWASNGRLV